MQTYIFYPLLDQKIDFQHYTAFFPRQTSDTSKMHIQLISISKQILYPQSQWVCSYSVSLCPPAPDFSTRFNNFFFILLTRWWQDLKDYMRQAGDVTYADAHKNKRNEGCVEFGSYSVSFDTIIYDSTWSRSINMWMVKNRFFFFLNVENINRTWVEKYLKSHPGLENSHGETGRNRIERS